MWERKRTKKKIEEEEGEEGGGKGRGRKRGGSLEKDRQKEDVWGRKIKRRKITALVNDVTCFSSAHLPSLGPTFTSFKFEFSLQLISWVGDVACFSSVIIALVHALVQLILVSGMTCFSLVLHAHVGIQSKHSHCTRACVRRACVCMRL